MQLATTRRSNSLLPWRVTLAILTGISRDAKRFQTPKGLSLPYGVKDFILKTTTPLPLKSGFDMFPETTKATPAKAVAEKIRMKSCCLAGVRLSHDHHDVGIIIIETTKATQPWRDEDSQQDRSSQVKQKVRDRIAEEKGSFTNLCEIAAEIIYIIRNSYDDVKRSK